MLSTATVTTCKPSIEYDLVIKLAVANIRRKAEAAAVIAARKLKTLGPRLPTQWKKYVTCKTTCGTNRNDEDSYKTHEGSSTFK
jgi:hypothetical protein